MNKEKTTFEQEMIDNINRAINELVYEKSQIIKAYNYYHGKRDPEQFRHLEENYGIGTPTSVEFIPLVKKHVDVLVGEYLSTPILPRISCKDKETLSNINRDKQNYINNEIAKELNKHLKNVLYSEIINDPKINDKEVEKLLENLHIAADRNFISDYEIAGQNIVDWTIQNRNIDFVNQRKILLIDLLVSGTGYYKTCPSPTKINIQLKVLNPINTFIDRNPDSVYLKNSARSVIRDYLTKDQILAKYGDLLTKDDLESLDLLQDYSIDGSSTTYLRSFDTVTGNVTSDGILGGFEITPLLPSERNTSKYFRQYPVYEVEWLKTEKENGKYITNRYEGVRIGTNIYILTGKSDNVVRSMDDPSACSLTVNGIFYSDRNGEPFSLLLKTANLQDKYDVIYFYRDNIIAESGGTGDFVDLAYLPKFLGTDVTERLMKWKAYKKSGMALVDSSQEGMPMNNTNINGYDDTVKLQAVQALNLVLQQIEETCSSITGIFREKLGGIEQKDAVTNVQVGVKQSSYITKQYYQIMDLMTREILLDVLNLTKIVYKKGITGTLILGDRLNKIFTALPEHYTVSDYDINIGDSSDIMKEEEAMKQLAVEFTKGQLVDADIILDMMTSKSLTKMKEDIKLSLENKRIENNQLGKLQQQAEQLQQQLKQLEQENQKLQQQLQRNNDEKMQMERERLQFDKELGWYEANNLKEYNEAKLEEGRDRVKLEAAQLLDDNYRNDEIKNS